MCADLAETLGTVMGLTALCPPPLTLDLYIATSTTFTTCSITNTPVGVPSAPPCSNPFRCLCCCAMATSALASPAERDAYQGIELAEQFKCYATVVRLCHTHDCERVLERILTRADAATARTISEETSKFYVTNRALRWFLERGVRGEQVGKHMHAGGSLLSTA